MYGLDRIFDTEYFVNLKPKDQWRSVFHESKDDLIASMDQQLEKIPGVIWGFSQPIEDNMEEAVSGVKGELSVKIYGDDFETLEQKGNEVVTVMARFPALPTWDCSGSSASRTLRSRLIAKRRRATALMLQIFRTPFRRRLAQHAQRSSEGEAQYDLVLRYQKQYRDTKEAIENVRLLSPSGERVSLAQLTKITTSDGAEEIYAKASSATLR